LGNPEIHSTAMKKRAKFLIVLGLVLVLLGSILFAMHYLAKARLAAYKRQLIASGEKLDIEQLVPTPAPHGQSNATALLKAAEGLTPEDDFYPHWMKLIKPGRARVAWRQAELMEEVGFPGVMTNIWPLLRAAQMKDDEKLTEIGGLLSSNNIQIPIDYQKGDAELFTNFSEHLIAGKRMAKYFAAEAILDLRDGRTNEAMRDLLRCVATSKIYDSEPFMISQMVRYAAIAIAVLPCWECLQLKGWTDAQLAELQRQWESIDLLEEAAKSLAMERAREPMSFDEMRSSWRRLDKMIPFDLADEEAEEPLRQNLIGFALHFGASSCRSWLWMWLWSYDDERLSMGLYQDMIDATRAAQKRQQILKGLPTGDAEEFLSLAFRPVVTNSKYRITSYERPLVKSFVTQSLRVQTKVEMVIAAIALERYSLRLHKYPARLEEMVPSIVKRVPIDYMDGKDLRYRLREDGTYLLYSVGDNGTDDGGDPTPPDGSSPQFQNGRDWVWPSVATDREVSEYAAGLARRVAQEQAEREQAGKNKR